MAKEIGKPHRKVPQPLMPLPPRGTDSRGRGLCPGAPGDGANANRLFPPVLTTTAGLRPGSLGVQVCRAPALNNLQKKAAKAYQNNGWFKKAKSLQLPTEGPIPFVPPKKWNLGNPNRTSDAKGFVDAFGNEWRRGPSRTNGEAFEWDVIPPRTSPLCNFSRDGSHVNVSLTGRVTHR